MAYGIKYRHSYCNEYGVNSSVTILENGYLGSVKDIDAQEDPIVISQEGSDTNKFDTIRPSTASIGLIGNESFKLEELFTADERKYMVENHVGGVMVWRGFVIPNGFSHEWTGGEFPMEIIASDNLSTLKDFAFLNDNGTVISGRLKHIDVLLKCLNKLDIGLDLLTLTNIVRQGGFAGEDPLFINTTDAYAFLSTDVREEGVDFYYENPENAFNCEDVVNAICKLYGAKLYQSNGYWRFKRVNVDYGASISGQTFNRYNTLGVNVGTVPYNEAITIPCTDYSGEKAQYSGARLSMSEVYKSSSSRYGFRYLTVGDKLPSIIKNQGLGYPFPVPDPTVFVPNDWEVKLYPSITTPNPVRSVNIAPELRPGGDFPPNTTGGALRIYGGNRRGIDSLRSKPIDTARSINKGDRLSVKLWHKTPLLFGGGNPISFYMIVRVILQTRNPDKAYYLTNSTTDIKFDAGTIPRLNFPSWTDSPVPLGMVFVGKRTSMSVGVYDWVNEYIISQAAPEDGTIYIEFAGIGYADDETRPTVGDTGTTIMATVPSSLSQGVDGYSISYSQKRVRLYNTEFKIGELETGVLYGGSSHSSGIIYTSEQTAKYTQRGERATLFTSDVLSINAINGVLTNGVFIDKWDDGRNTYGAFKPLGLMLTRDVMRQYKNVWRVIEEDIKANGLSFDTTIEFEERPGERYVIQRGSISQKFNRLIGCTLIQVSANPDTSFVGNETTEEDFKNEGGGSGGSSGGGGSGGGSGSAPQDLQSVTDIGAETTNIITAKGLRASDILQVPIIPSEENNTLWLGAPSTTEIPIPIIANLEDLQNVQSVIANGKFLQKINGIWTGVDMTIPDLSNYYTKLQTDNLFVAKITGYGLSQNDFTNTLKTKLDSLTAYSAGSGIAITAGSISVNTTVIRTTGDQSMSGVKSFTGELVIPQSAGSTNGSAWLGAPSGTEIPTPIVANLEDLQNVQSTIANGKFLQKIGGVWIGVDAPSGASYTAGTGLNLIGNVFSVNFGITAGTVAEGNHTHAVVTTAINGFMSAADKVKLNGIAASANNYVHPAKTWVDKTALSGAVVISNLTIDALGHPTNWVTRSLTAANIGAEPAFTKMTGFNKNFGAIVGTVMEGNDTRVVQAYGWGNHAGRYPLYDGTGAMGTWGINITGQSSDTLQSVTARGNSYYGSVYFGGAYANGNQTKIFLRNEAGRTWALSSGANNIGEPFFALYDWSGDQESPYVLINPNIRKIDIYASLDIRDKLTAPTIQATTELIIPMAEPVNPANGSMWLR